MEIPFYNDYNSCRICLVNGYDVQNKRHKNRIINWFYLKKYGTHKEYPKPFNEEGKIMEINGYLYMTTNTFKKIKKEIAK